jgi:hypothetical protein
MTNVVDAASQVDDREDLPLIITNPDLRLRPRRIDHNPRPNREVSSSGPDTESRTANCVNDWMGLFAIDLSSQTSDVHINKIRRRVEMQTPNVLQQQTSSDDLTGMASKILQESEFPGP